MEEIDRLTKYKAECAQKDVVINNLLREVQSLKKQLELLKDGADTGMVMGLVPYIEAAPYCKCRPQIRNTLHVRT